MSHTIDFTTLTPSLLSELFTELTDNTSPYGPRMAWKFSNGWAATISNVSITTPWGGSYIGNIEVDLDYYAGEFFVSKPFVQITPESAGSTFWIGADSDSFDTNYIRSSAITIIRGTSGTIDVTLNILAFGKWK